MALEAKAIRAGSGGPVVCIGEILWDALPAALYLGGAPFNVACHLKSLGCPVEFVSRVGDDELGREACKRAEKAGISSRFVQTDPKLPTGFVRVDIDALGVPTFEILKPAAWDAIEASEAILEAVRLSRAVVFGSLAQRCEKSRETINKILDQAPLRVFDVNMRAPYASQELIEQSLRQCDLLKLNDAELKVIAMWNNIVDNDKVACRALADIYSIKSICVTRGAQGAALLLAGKWYEEPGHEVTVKDTVGAGDAFLAALIMELSSGQGARTALRCANAVGAYVATCAGATPMLDACSIAKLRDGRPAIAE